MLSGGFWPTFSFGLEDIEFLAGWLSRFKHRLSLCHSHGPTGGCRAGAEDCRADGHRPRNFRGRILGVANDHVVVEDRTSGRVEIPLDGVVKANLEADVESELRARRDDK